MERLLVLFLLIVSTVGCTAVSETTDLGSSPNASPTATPAFNCSYYSMFDSLTTCQSTTLANCDWEWKTFPTGGVGVCYQPVTGWESCATTPTDWIYTSWNLSCRESGNTYRIARSVVSCSSATCACLNPQMVQTTCTAGVDCPVAIPFPSPTPNCP